MTNYTCYMCNKVFVQKSHYDAHLARKKTCQKCPIGFNSQFCFIREWKGNKRGNNQYILTSIHIDDYREQYSGSKRKAYCRLGHELTLCNGGKNIPYFRHKNTSDMEHNNISDWHLKMQGYFPVTEKYFPNNYPGQLKSRRADVVIENHNWIIEIQHSKIDDANVKCRHDDYKLHNMNVTWLIDGNTNDVIIDELYSGGFLIIFKEDWKYKSFVKCNPNVLLEWNDKIFKIPTKEVNNKMFLAKEWKPIEFIMKQLNTNPKEIWDKWDDDNEKKASLKVYQRGAGNGKTFEVWKSILENKDKNTFIILTKQHSAKEVIIKELDDQAKRNEMHIEENMLDESQESYSNKYKVTYTHKKTLRKCIVIVATIDSFIYNIGDTNISRGTNFFQKLVGGVASEGPTKLNSNTGSFKYAGENLFLNKKAEIWIDEASDLDENYYQAFIKTILATKIDVAIVGDKLQSLDNPINMMTLANNINNPNICIEKKRPSNINRRICVKGMKEELNELINFEGHELPEISIDSNRENELLERDEPVIEVIEQPPSTLWENINNEEDREKRAAFIDLIIKKIDFEIDKYNYSPEDFEIIFPIMQKNTLALELETRINEYMINKFPQNEYKYRVYAVCHRHEEGTVIDMSISVKATRIVTIKTSKGDGRKVVFVLSCTEKNLDTLTYYAEKNLDTLTCNGKKSLTYESYFHVSLTRAKEKIYFGLVKNNDNIHSRFGDVGLSEYKPDISMSPSLDNLIQNINEDSLIEILKKNGIEDLVEKDKSKKQNEMVDWNYHCIRHAIYLMYCISNIFSHGKNKDNFKYQQLYAILNKIKECKIKDFKPTNFYTHLKEQSKKVRERHKPDRIIPLCILSTKEEYYAYSRKIKDVMEKNIKKCNDNILSIADFSPLEMVIQSYMMELWHQKNYHETTPTTIYNVIDYFEKEDRDEHKVKKLLKETEDIKDTINKAMNEITSTDKNVGWNYGHLIQFGSKSKEIKLRTKPLDIIGYGDKTVYHMVFQSDFSKLNYWSTLLDVLFQQFMIYNVSDKHKDISKFKNKAIKTYLFSLKDKSYEVFYWNWDKDLNIEIKKLLREGIIKYYSIFNNRLHKYCTFLRAPQSHDIWKKENFRSPYDYIAWKYGEEDDKKIVSYVRDFFRMLDKLDKEVARKIAEDKEIFCTKLMEYLKDSCDRFLELNTNSDDTNSDDDW